MDKKTSTQNIHENILLRVNKKLTLKIYVAYGLGHILNDVCSAMWFSYLLVFFQLVLGYSTTDAAALLLVGQVADAVATPIVGYNSDKNHDWWIYKFGKRKIWYFMGTICVLVAFPFIFSPCINCQDAPRLNRMIYYSFFVVMFQFGWAAVQIAHLSLIPEITSKEHEKTRLAAIRNGGTVVASVLVYLVTWSILHISGGSENQIDISYASRFQHIVWSVMAFGTVCSITFYAIIKEPESKKFNNQEDFSAKVSFKQVCLDVKLYIVGTVYMSSRLFINLTQVFISLYLAKSLTMVASSLAIVPLVMYISSFAASFPVGPLTQRVGRKIVYIIGACFGLVGCLWIQWGQDDLYKNYFIFVVAFFLGMASTIVLVASLDFTTDFIGSSTNRGAFIYGIMSFADKMANGIAVEIIQVIYDDSNIDFYKNVLTYVCGGALILGTLSALLVNSSKVQRKRNRHKSTDTLTESISTVSQTV
ncbi:major facilitator superfamily domain-containing protein 12-like [Anthonomus grandis grandis]|uniref:major facilitator superfamily domain-containing protein 12-like n=1 Tax=Anthonomus grandis grandis TaxID=2921223 RepID=UPI00216594B3|nr:major facilitator superfamily domain-containing protein 12-like [Anthonomus grandis grandis]XP_050296374.1 major facilitator superfamily domain-containing protein 12-like [Anthonomus grandis grandis]